MTLTLIMMLARQFRIAQGKPTEKEMTDRMIGFMDEHLDHMTLSVLSSEFGYHPAYISSRLSEKTGKTFSQILLVTENGARCVPDEKYGSVDRRDHTR
jgi:AraC-like DNA-binding protein